MKAYYQVVGHEIDIFHSARELKLPLLLKGPTGCGKSRFIEAMSEKYDLPLVKVSCNEDTTASDLLGRFLLKGNETVWQDGPATRAARDGALLYLDEIAEAREDVVVVLHSLTDFRRELYLDRINETVKAHPRFMLVASYNPGYQSKLKELKPSTRQRFLNIEFNYPHEQIETEIICKETGCELTLAKKLVALAKNIRSLTDLGLRETVSTRLLIYAASLIKSGVSPRLACEVSIAQSLSDDSEIILALKDLISLKM